MSHPASPAQGASPCCGDLLYSPVRRKSQTMTIQVNMCTVNVDENNRERRRDHGGLRVWIKTDTKNLQQY